MWMMNYFGGRRDPKQSAREAIVTLREQLLMNEKKEDLLKKKIEQAQKTASENAIKDKQTARHALRQKKVHEAELDRLANLKMQLELQINTLEGANMNAETMLAMKKGSDALKTIHGKLNIDKVETIMADVEDQRLLANEIADVIARPSNDMIDEDELNEELEQLQQEELDQQLVGAAHVPAHVPVGAIKSPPARSVEEDEEEELRKLQESLAMPS